MKEPTRIKPLGYQECLFCNYHRRFDHTIKECYHLKNLIQDLHDEGKFKFDREVSNEILQQHREKPVQDGPIHP